MRKLLIACLFILTSFTAFAEHDPNQPDVTLTASVEMFVNNEPVSAGCVNFVKNFFDSTISGMLKPLRGVDKIETLDIQIDNSDEIGIKIILNQKNLPMNHFVKKMIKNVIVTMFNTLDDIPEIRQARILIVHP